MGSIGTLKYNCSSYKKVTTQSVLVYSWLLFLVYLLRFLLIWYLYTESYFLHIASFLYYILPSKLPASPSVLKSISWLVQQILENNKGLWGQFHIRTTESHRLRLVHKFSRVLLIMCAPLSHTNTLRLRIKFSVKRGGHKTYLRKAVPLLNRCFSSCVPIFATHFNFVLLQPKTWKALYKYISLILPQLMYVEY